MKIWLLLTIITSNDKYHIILNSDSEVTSAEWHVGHVTPQTSRGIAFFNCKNISYFQDIIVKEKDEIFWKLIIKMGDIMKFVHSW